MAAHGTPVASLGEVPPAELYLDGTWRAAALLGWRHDADGRCRVRVRVDWAGAPRVVWAPLELLRLPEPASTPPPGAGQSDVVVPVPPGSLPPPHRIAAPLPPPRRGRTGDAGRWTSGRPVPGEARAPRRPETWREDHPHPELMRRREYEPQKHRLQIELLKLHHLPGAGEIVLFDRSWYGRPAVEIGDESSLHALSASERLLVAGGLHLVELWLSVSRGEQRTRLALRGDRPTLSADDLAVLDRWDEHTAAEEAVLAATSTPRAPWTLVLADDRRRARLEAMRHVLSVLGHPGREEPDPLVVAPAQDLSTTTGTTSA